MLPTASAEGKIHLGMGCYLRTDNARRDIRTLSNATCQFWSILTLLTINKMHKLADRDLQPTDIYCLSTIYDSIYYAVKADAVTIKWVNDYLIACMTKDFMEDQTIKNEVEAEIGLNWASLHRIRNNASIEEIQEVLDSL